MARRHLGGEKAAGDPQRLRSEPVRAERLYAPAPDGSQVPVSLVYRKGLTRDGSHPLLLEGYGSYGFSTEPSFDARRLSLLDRGFVYAIAHVRGGSELGRAWYEQGRLMHKKNSFTDLIACAEHLIAQGYTSPERPGDHGRERRRAVGERRDDHAARPVPSRRGHGAVYQRHHRHADAGPAADGVECEQWGNPDDAQAFDYMLSYSPYDNVEAKAYPPPSPKPGSTTCRCPTGTRPSGWPGCALTRPTPTGCCW